MIALADKKSGHFHGTSYIPHYWYREFDLDLGESKGNILFGEFVWSREFENAVVIVNPDGESAQYTWDALTNYFDVEGNHLESPLDLDGRSAMLLVKNLSVLP